MSDETIVMDAMGSGGAPQSSYMSEFFREMEEVNAKIEHIESDVERASKLHSRVLASPTNDAGLFNQLNLIIRAYKFQIKIEF
jgi:hypothetical protein